MAFLPLRGGAYQSSSVLVAAQRCLNLLPELLPPEQGEPVPAVDLLTPGLRLTGVYGDGAWRCLYRSTTGVIYGVVGSELITVGAGFGVTALGTLPSGSGPVSMSDNGVDLLVVDGSARGFTVLLATGAFSEVVDPAFYGGDRVDCLDGFFVLNRPGTNQFYLSNNVSLAWDPLYIAAKAGKDTLVSLAVVSRELWLFGERITEIWQNTGASDFPLQIMSGGIEHGACAAQSVRATDGQMLWLGRDRDGQAVVLLGAHYGASRVSTHAIEQVIQKYATVSDAVGWSYQINGHTIYVLTFPAADATWCFDLSSRLWHEWSSSPDASIHRHRGVCHTAAYGRHLVGDWANGNLYALDAATANDNGSPIQRVRSFPHVVTDADRVFYHRFVADMRTGSVPAGQPEPQLTLRWSDDGGASFGQPVTLGMGPSGAANTSLQFRRLGTARSRVFELSWNADVQTSLSGAWVETGVARS